MSIVKHKHINTSYGKDEVATNDVSMAIIIIVIIINGSQRVEYQRNYETDFDQKKIKVRKCPPPNNTKIKSKTRRC